VHLFLIEPFWPSSFALFAWLISHQPTVLFSHNKPATSNQPTVLFSQNKSAPVISHQPNEHADWLICRPTCHACILFFSFNPKSQQQLRKKKDGITSHAAAASRGLAPSYISHKCGNTVVYLMSWLMIQIHCKEAGWLGSLCLDWWSKFIVKRQVNLGCTLFGQVAIGVVGGSKPPAVRYGSFLKTLRFSHLGALQLTIGCRLKFAAIICRSNCGWASGGHGPCLD
jgi:hypothetical protein